MFARTERLLLRPGWREDAQALYEAIRDPGIIRNLASAPWPYGLSDAEAFLASERGPHEPCCLIFLRTLGAPKLIGGTGFGRMPDGRHELGYWIARPYWGLGFATEAGRAMIDIARGLRLKTIEASHFVDNPASGRVLRKLGFKPTGAIVERYSAGRAARAPSRSFELNLGGESAAACDMREAEAPEKACAMAA
ncbi:GNAT family N-acetyltransferase [Sphingosinicella sp. CPCC 101087]|uniref:GNAT family N-acetyltransferase n=1 Tax=Sphingosinicella sp. CPCC 101087 TaxID=2497754 RepID=UPI00101DB7B1|nr:GNAT family N-acetyltransferase [Sphingosinicella sp. CPCC 101087]